ncbi:MAG: hypothetical protein AAGF11_41345 [Myxococcota bacterium]
MSMNPTTRIITSLSAAAWLGLGCGGEPVNLDAVDPTSTSSTGSGSSEEGTSESTQQEQSCEWVTRPLPGVFDPGPECRHLVNLEEVAPITFRLVNNGGSPLYLTTPSLCDPYYVAVRDIDGSWFPGSDTVPLCAASVQGDCSTLLCSTPPTIRLEPGSMFETQWAGFVLEVIEASDACVGPCAGPCERRVPPRGSTVEIRTGLIDEAECEAETECECEPNADGWCEIPAPASTVRITKRHDVEWPPACPVVELPLL